MAQPALFTPTVGYPASASYLTSQVYSPLAWIYGQIGNPNGWVPLANLGTYQNGATAASGAAAPMAQDVLIAGGRVRMFRGIVNLSGVTTSSYTFFTFSSSYIPAYERDWPIAGSSSAPFRTYASTSGNWGITNQASGTSTITLDGFQMINPTGTI